MGALFWRGIILHAEEGLPASVPTEISKSRSRYEVTSTLWAPPQNLGVGVVCEVFVLHDECPFTQAQSYEKETPVTGRAAVFLESANVVAPGHCAASSPFLGSTTPCQTSIFSQGRGRTAPHSSQTLPGTGLLAIAIANFSKAAEKLSFE